MKKKDENFGTFFMFTTLIIIVHFQQTQQYLTKATLRRGGLRPYPV